MPMNVYNFARIALIRHPICAAYKIPQNVLCRQYSSSNDVEPLKSVKLDFRNTKTAYIGKSTWELLRGMLVLHMCTYDFLVKHNRTLLKVSRKLMGKHLFKLLMKSTFYGHFVAGEDQHDIKPYISKARKYGVKSILDYSVEEDVPESEAVNKVKESLAEAVNEPRIRPQASSKKYQTSIKHADRSKEVYAARTYFYKSEAQCDKNMYTFLECIDAVSGSTNKEGFAAIKLTALGRPQFLTGKLEQLVPTLTREGLHQLRNMIRRIDTIAMHAKETGVRVMIDAEQTYFQPAIRRIVMEMMRRFNQDSCVVYNTYQCYLKDAHNQLALDLKLSEQEDFFFGAKLVRGAYMDQERARAIDLDYDDPINPSYDATTDMYEKCLEYGMTEIGNRKKGAVSIMVATHNESTVQYAIDKMAEFGVRPDHRVICFGQLLGMCDQISYSLGQNGYSVYKYVPYGPVDEVLPYLSRRAAENQSVLSGTAVERTMLKQELKRRFKEKELFYKP